MHADVPRVAFYSSARSSTSCAAASLFYAAATSGTLSSELCIDTGKPCLPKELISRAYRRDRRMTECPRDIARPPRAPSSCRRCLSAPRGIAVLRAHIINELIAAVVGEVHIDIRRPRRSGLRNRSKGMLILEGAHRRDAGKVRDERTCRGASCVGKDAHFARGEAGRRRRGSTAHSLFLMMPSFVVHARVRFRRVRKAPPEKPASASAASSLSAVLPSGWEMRGIAHEPSLSGRSHRDAMRALFSRASGRSANSSFARACE